MMAVVTAICAALVIAYAARLIMNVLGSRAKPSGKYDKLLDRAAEQGFVVTAEVIRLDAVKTQQLELDAFERRSSYRKPEPLRHAYHKMQDSRVSYKPTVRVMLGGTKRELEYFRYVSDRELHLQEGQTVRICISPDAPQQFVIVGDKAAYGVLRQIVG